MEPPALNAAAIRKNRKRVPLGGAAVALGCGVVAGRYLDLPAAFWGFLAAGGLLVAAVSFRRRHLHLIAAAGVAIAIVSVGAAHVRLAYFTVGEDHVVTYTGEAPILATLRGRIVTSPMSFADTAPLGYRRPDRTGFVLDAGRVRTGGGWEPVSGLVRVSIREPARHLAAGQQVELLGWMGRFRSPANPGQFDRASAARRTHTLVWMTVPAADGATILTGAKMSWHRRIYWRVRAASRQHLMTLGDAEEGRILNALILGERHPALGGLNRAMVRAGVAHFLSISGLHLGVFLGFVYLLCRLCLLTDRRSAAVALIVLIAYVLLAEPRAPLLRSGLMAAALCLATISRRRYSGLNALAAAAIVLLAIDPLQLFSPGFQLSFVIVTALVVGHRPVRGLLFGRWLRRRGLMVFRTDQAFRRRLHYAFQNRLMDAATIALVAYTSSAPLVAYHFGLFSPYAVVLNVLLFPLVVAVLIPGYVSMALLAPLPGLSHTVGHAASAAAGLLAQVLDALDHLPGLSFSLRPLHPAWVVLCYAALALIVLSRRIPLGRLWSVLAVTALCAWTAVSQLPAPAPLAAELHLLSVGAGQCAILHTPAGKTVIIDAGTRGGYDAYRDVIAPFLHRRRLPAPRHAFISHANTDHFNALLTPLRAGSLDRVYLNDYFGLEAPSPSLEESAPAAFMEELAAADVEVARLREGETVVLGPRTKVEVVWPPRTTRDDLSVNDSSLVLRITCDGRTVLIAGDLDEGGQRELIRTPEKIAADVLILPHHGGWEKSLPDFCRAVNPRVVLVSCGRDPATGAGGDDERARFYTHLRTTTGYHSTNRDGWIRIRLSRAKIDVQTMR